MTIIVCLSGGLGNQFFQISTAIRSSGGSDILIDSFSNSPELSSDGNPSFLDFDFASNQSVKLAKIPPKIIQRAVSLNLRLSLSNKKSFSAYTILLSSRLVVVCYYSIRYLRIFRLITPKNVSDIPVSNLGQNLILNGYFQSSHLLENGLVRKSLKSVRLKAQSPEVDRWIGKAKKTRPIVVHFRIGDYSNHPGMGILDPEYFVEGIRRLSSHTTSDEIWLFSDEPMKALRILKEKGMDNLVLVPTLDAASTLEIMRLGSGFVISNSTFSWWAASLRYDPTAKVIAPSPWFRTQESPKFIYMKDWILLRSW